MPREVSRTRRASLPWQASHPSKNGSSTPSAGFDISANPHNIPYPHQSRTRSDSASFSVAHKIVAAKSADSEVSQIHSNGIIMPLGKSAHSHAAKLATHNPPIRFPAKKTGTQAAEEKTIFIKTAAKKARAVKIPKILNIPATNSG